MNIPVEIDKGSGFCFGVTRAIKKAEEELQQQDAPLYCLGDIVHNGRECDRLRSLGLVTIDHDDLDRLPNQKVLLRAHGEPPSTYERASRQGIELIDATCPVVLHLQERIKKEYHDPTFANKQIVIFGKPGHAEVLGLLGQTDGRAIVVENLEEVRQRLDFTRDIRLYSQTTKSLDDFREIVAYIEEHISPEATFQYFDTICRQVANRMSDIRAFAQRHELVLFVCGKKSSNGKVLFHECKSVNGNAYLIEDPSEIDFNLVKRAASVGICGATSTPGWLMEACKQAIEAYGE